MLRPVPATLNHYEQVAAAFPDTESLSVLTVAGATRDQVVAQLEVDLRTPVDDDWPDQDGTTSWAILEIPGGVLAVEVTGFGDPSRADLAALSIGGAASVVRSNVLAHYRFGCARAGELEFDADEYIYVEDPNTVPDELQDLFRLAYDDLAEESDNSEDHDPFAVGLAMCEVVTGLEISAEQVQAVLASGFFAAPSMRYPTELEREAEANGGSAPRSDDIPHAHEGGRVEPSPSHWLAATRGVYAIGGEFPGTFSEPPAEWPTDAFCVAVDPDTAWVRKLSTQPDTRIRPLAVYAETEPTMVLQEAAEAYEHQTSAVLYTRFGDALRVYDSDFTVRLYLTEGQSTYQLRVFAKLPDEEHDYEEHLLVAWPDPNAQPDVVRT
jgi:hypothetical protein